MLWLRRGFVYFLSLLLLIALLGMATTVGTNQTLGKPKKVEKLLSESKLYDHFVSYATSQAKKSTGDDQSGSVSLNDTAVQSAAESAFSPQLIEQNVNTFLDSNYAWLEGKTATPNFKIDLSAAKETFAQQVGRYVTTFTAGLPVCTAAQLAQLQQQAVDPLTATCRPSNISPEVAGAQVTQQLSSSGDFLSNPVITANTINPDQNPQAKPYYAKFVHLPKLYQIGTKLPFAFAGLAVITALGVVYVSLERRKGVRRVGVVLAIAGVLLIVTKFVTDFGFNKAEHRVFNNANNGQLQQSLTDFGHRVESELVKMDLIFGVAFLLLAAIIFGLLRKRSRQQAASTNEKPPGEDHIAHAGDTPLVPPLEETPIQLTPTPRRQPQVGSAPAPKQSGGQSGTGQPKIKKRPKPRLIQ